MLEGGLGSSSGLALLSMHQFSQFFQQKPFPSPQHPPVSLAERMLWQLPLLHLSKSVHITHSKTQKKNASFPQGFNEAVNYISREAILAVPYSGHHSGWAWKGRSHRGCRETELPETCRGWIKHSSCSGSPPLSLVTGFPSRTLLDLQRCVSALAVDPREQDVVWVVCMCCCVYWCGDPARSGCVLIEEMWCLIGCFDAQSELHVVLWACAGRLLNIVSPVLEIASWARQWRYCWAGRGDIGWAVFQEVFSCSFLCDSLQSQNWMTK